MMIKYLHSLFPKGSKVLILGFGREGKSTFKFLYPNFPEIHLGIADASEIPHERELDGVDLHCGPEYLNAIDNYDWVIKSPGVKLPALPKEKAIKITSQTNLFLKIYGRQTIGISGTKGKSTTASLTYHLLKKSNRKVLLMGNIGLPSFDFINDIEKDTVVVYELSAHQLQYVDHSPHVAVLINLFPEHLDFFEDFETYRYAKENLFRFQQTGDIAICGPAVKNSHCQLMSDIKKETEILFGATVIPATLLLRTGLQGDHNLQNILLASKAAKSVGLTGDEIYAGLRGFKPLAHRLEKVGAFGGIRFVNDSIATIPQATRAAVQTLGKVDALILGGFDRGLDYSCLVDFLAASQIGNFFFLGRAGQRMFDLFCQKQTSQNLYKVIDLEEIFSILQKSENVHSCLLSPAAASYDQFHNFEHRGDRFKALAAAFRKGTQ